MSKKIPITNLHHFTDWSATQSENSSIRFDFSSKIHSARAAQTAWQNRSERCWKMDDQRPSNAWTRFALGDLGGISSPKRLLLWSGAEIIKSHRIQIKPTPIWEYLLLHVHLLLSILSSKAKTPWPQYTYLHSTSNETNCFSVIGIQFLRTSRMERTHFCTIL